MSSAHEKHKGKSEGMLLAALGRGRLPRILEVAARRPFVVFGTLEREVLAGLDTSKVIGTASALPVYLYETA